MDAGYALSDETPSAEDYLRLRLVTGLSPKSAAGAAIGLPNTIFGVVVRKDGRVVGMGRLVGDGGLMFQVSDIAVEPEHQGRGIGKAIVQRIVEEIHRTLPDGAYVSLIADGEAHRLYGQFGFVPTAPASIGMEMHVRPLKR
jgi:GNAT superfamily N-acetyltransferase